METAIQQCIAHDHEWLVFHIEGCEYWQKLQKALRGHKLMSVCISDGKAEETAACKDVLQRITGLSTTPCVFYRGELVGDSAAGLQRLQEQKIAQAKQLLPSERRWR